MIIVAKNKTLPPIPNQTEREIAMNLGTGKSSCVDKSAILKKFAENSRPKNCRWYGGHARQLVTCPLEILTDLLLSSS
jgi:hypothetical protein